MGSVSDATMERTRCFVLGGVLLLSSLSAGNIWLKKASDGQHCSPYESCVHIKKCFTQFKDFEDMAENSCGRGKVFCRNQRNPCEIFQQSGLLYSPEDGKCYQPLLQGPCKAGHWLATSTEEKQYLTCQPQPCSDPAHVLMAGQCRPYTDVLCPGFGEVWVTSSTGEAVCTCDTGFVRGQDGNCHQLFTKGSKGYCKDNKIVFEINNIGMCVENPCPTNSMPHLHTWKKALDSMGEVECHFVDEDLTDCEVEINDDDDLVCGSIRYNKASSIFTSCLGNKCCGKRKRWCKYRSRCVPVFRTG